MPAYIDPEGHTEGVFVLEHRDEGCEFFKACLNCPLPRCAFEGEPAKGCHHSLRVAPLITEAWALPGADLPQLFKAAQVCLRTKPSSVKELSPEFLEAMQDAYGSPEGSR